MLLLLKLQLPNLRLGNLHQSRVRQTEIAFSFYFPAHRPGIRPWSLHLSETTGKYRLQTDSKSASREKPPFGPFSAVLRRDPLCQALMGASAPRF